jgi:hypothetical protein
MKSMEIENHEQYKKSWLLKLGMSIKKNPPYGFSAPMSNLNKVPFWTSQFGPNHYD